VLTESPVTVFVPDAADADDAVDADDDGEADGAEDEAAKPEPDEAELVPGPTVLTAAGGAATEAVWVLNDRRASSPATVLANASTTRRMRALSSVMGNQNSKDS